MKNFFVGVKGVIFDSENRILVIKRSGPKGFWELPGGRIDDDETIKETLKRELKEELPNIKLIKIGSIINAHRTDFDLKDNLGLVLLFYVVEAEFKGEITLSEEHADYKWVSIDSALKICDKQVLSTLKILKSRQS